jgi:hypothetical protein
MLPVIKVGDIVRRIEFQGMPEAFVIVVEKEELHPGFFKYTVLQPDGTIDTYTDAVVRKIK